MTQIVRSARRPLIAVLLVAFAAVAGDAFAQGQGQGQGRGNPPDSPGRSAERRRGDNPRVPNDGPAQPVAAIPASGDYRIDALLSGYTLSTTTVTYSFYEQDVFAGGYYGTEVVSEVSEPVKTNVRAIMAWYGTMMNVNFVEVPETSSAIGYIRVMRSTAPSYAYAYYPSGSSMFSLSGDVHLNPSYDRLGDTNGFQHPAGEHGYTTLIHEIGHALGLKHPHSGSPTLPANEDNHTRTVMSYGFPGESPGTPMGYDIMALQYIYGARAYRTLNDAYQFTRSDIDQYSLGGQLYITPTLRTKQAIWDSGGYNVLDLSAFTASTSGYRLDLNPLGWLSTHANYLTTYLMAGAVIGPGVSIRMLINSGSSDTITANADPNVFAGYAPNRVTGTDVIYGADGQDTLDLSGYPPGQVFESVSGNDLLLSLGANGSVRLKDFYLGTSHQPVVVYTAVTPSVSIADVTVNEGGGTTTANFVVTLSTPSASAQSVSFATANGSAAAGTDYVALSGVLTFAAGETQKIVGITVTGDAVQEPDETFLVTLSTPSAGIDVLDGDALGTILNDDLPPNVLPVAVASPTSASGVAPLTVTFTGSTSYDPDGSIASYAWTFGDGTSSTAANPSHTYTTPGTYTAILTVTDNRGGTDAAQVAITVSQSPALVMHVGSISMAKLSSGGSYSAQARVTVLNSSNQAVPGATVTVNWTGLAKSTSAGTTDVNGQVVLTSRASRRRGTFTVTITGVSKSGSTYDSGSSVKTASIAVP